MLAGAYSVSDNLAYYTTPEIRDAHFQSEITNNLGTALTSVKLLEGEYNLKYDLEVFNYRLETQVRQISYIICRNPLIEVKFRDDPLFSLVFINEEVAIYKVNGDLNQG